MKDTHKVSENMPTITNRYMGSLRTTATHLQSGDSMITDAPTDNKGKGEAFSPTDLLAGSLSACMITTMGIVAENEGIDMSGVHTEVLKVMASDPRRVSEIHINMYWENCSASESEKERLKKTALNCPVALSLNSNIKQMVNFHF